MFGPAFFTGRLIERFGKETITAIGLVMIAIAAVINPSAASPWRHFWGRADSARGGLELRLHRRDRHGDGLPPAGGARQRSRARTTSWSSARWPVASFSAGKLLDVGGLGERFNWLVFPPIAVALLLVRAAGAPDKRMRAA